MNIVYVVLKEDEYSEFVTVYASLELAQRDAHRMMADTMDVYRLDDAASNEERDELEATWEEFQMENPHDKIFIMACTVRF